MTVRLRDHACAPVDGSPVALYFGVCCASFGFIAGVLLMCYATGWAPL